VDDELVLPTSATLTILASPNSFIVTPSWLSFPNRTAGRLEVDEHLRTPVLVEDVSKAPSLTTLQFWYTSTNDAPGCSLRAPEGL